MIYQIYPRSFRDTNGDGVGDLPGITEMLDYVADIGVDAIWIAPFFPSPMRDFGYDVSEYCAVDPLFGTLADFDALIARAHELGLRVMIDQVWSHTSDEHAWFVDSRSSCTAEKADWYVWADPRSDGLPPNNWLSVFGGSAWTWEPRRRQYYLHHFLPSQPQLNLYHPQVVDALLETGKFWLERGIDGFRLDAVDFMFHDRELRDNPPRRTKPSTAPVRPFAMQHHLYDMLQAETLDFMSRIKQVVARYPGVATLGEVSSEEGAYYRCAAYTDSGEDRLDMAYSLALMKEPLASQRLKQVLIEMEGAIENGCVCWAFSNHDVVRAVTRWGVEHPDPALARTLLALLITLPGSACLYQGEELGLGEAKIAKEDMRDPYGVAFYPVFRGRDGARTPMPWSFDQPFAGFTSGEQAWLPVPPGHLPLAVDRQLADQASILRWSQQLLWWRRNQPALRCGSFHVLPAPDPLFVFERRSVEQRILMIFNLSKTPISIARSMLPQCRPLHPFSVDVRAADENILLSPFSVLVAAIDN